MLNSLYERTSSVSSSDVFLAVAGTSDGEESGAAMSAPADIQFEQGMSGCEPLTLCIFRGYTVYSHHINSSMISRKFMILGAQPHLTRTLC